MRRSKFINRFFCFVILAVIFCSGAQGTVKNITDKSGLLLPPDIGVVKESFKGDGELTVIHVQDIHSIAEVQSNIASIIGLLKDKYGVTTVASEGIVDKIDALAFQSFPVKSIRDAVAKSFLQDGVISGVEYYSIASDDPVAIYGADNAELYRKNLSAYLDILSLEDDFAEVIGSLKATFDVYGSIVYSDEFKDFRRTLDGFSKSVDSLDMEEYVKFLVDESKSHGLDVGGSEYLNIFLKCKDLETKFEYSKVNQEYSQFFNYLKAVLTGEKLHELNKKDLGYKINRVSQSDYYSFLVELAEEKGVSLHDYSNLNHYVEYIKTLDKLHLGELLKECKRLEYSVSEKILTAQNQNACFKFSKAVDILDKFHTLDLSPDDIAFLRSNSDMFVAENLYSFLNRESETYKIKGLYVEDADLFDKYVESLTQFYFCAQQRDAVLVDRMLARMKENNADVAVLIAGGFHTDGIKRCLEEKNISYHVVVPQVNSIPENNSYLELLTGQHQWETVLTRAGTQTLVLASWMDSASIREPERKEDLADALKSVLIADTVSQYTREDVASLSDVVKKAMRDLVDWKKDNAPKISLVEAKKVGSVLFVVLNVDGTSMAFTYYDQYDYSARFVLPNNRISLITPKSDGQVVREILTYADYKKIVKNSPKFLPSSVKFQRVSRIVQDKSEKYSHTLLRGQMVAISKNQDMLAVLKDIAEGMSNSSEKTRLGNLEQTGDMLSYVKEFFNYYGDYVSRICDLLNRKYPGIIDGIRIDLSMGGNELVVADKSQKSIVVDINALRSSGLLFAKLESAFLSYVYEAHIERVLKTLEMSGSEMNDYRNILLEFFVMENEINRYKDFGFDPELGGKTFLAMLHLVGRGYVDHRMISIVSLNEQDQMEKMLSIVKEKFSVDQTVYDRLTDNNYVFLKQIQSKFNSSLYGVEGEYDFFETSLENFINLKYDVNTIDDVQRALKDHNVEFITVNFVDHNGVTRNVLLPVSETKDLLEKGLPLTGSSIQGDNYIFKDDKNAVVIPSRLKIYRGTPNSPVVASIWATPGSREEKSNKQLTKALDFSKKTFVMPKMDGLDEKRVFIKKILKEKGITKIKIAVPTMDQKLMFFDLDASELETDDSVWHYGVSIPAAISNKLPSEKNVSELIAKLDLDSLRFLDWQDGSDVVAMINCDIVDTFGNSFSGDLRGLLKKTIKEAEDRNLDPQVEFGPQFCLFDENERLVDDKGYYSDMASVSPGVKETLQEIMIAAQNAGIDVKLAHHALSSGQYRISLGKTSAVRAVDNVMLFKNIVRRAAQKNHLQVSFDPKITGMSITNGSHINMSCNGLSGENAFVNGNDPTGFSEIGKKFTSGIFSNMRDVTALTNQHPLSYDRLNQGNTPNTVSVAGRNRSASLLIHKDVGNTNLEVRFTDAMGAEYLTLATIIYAGLQGLKDETTPVPELVEENIYRMTSAEKKRVGIAQLPSGMAEAIGILKSSDLVKEFLPFDVRMAMISRAKRLIDRKIILSEKVETIEDVARALKEHNVTFIDIKFNDPQNMSHGVLGLSTLAKSLLEEGIGTDGSSMPAFESTVITESDLAIEIDPGSVEIYKGKNGQPNYAVIWGDPKKPSALRTRELDKSVETDKFKPRTVPKSNKDVFEILDKKNITEVKLLIMTHDGKEEIVRVSVDDLKKDNLFNQGIPLSDEICRKIPTLKDKSGFIALPDISSLRTLDLRADESPEAFMYVDMLDENGNSIKSDYRNILKELTKKVKERLNAEPIMAPEPEFFILKPDDSLNDKDAYYGDFTTMDNRVRDMFKDILLTLLNVGIDARYVHHEVAPSQYEIPVGVGTALDVADNTMIFKMLIKRLAKKYGLKASFQAKVISGENGSGMHVHQSLKSLENGKNLFYDENDKFGMGLSEIAHAYVEGILRHPEITALANPTENSYKRLVPGYEAPIAVAWGEKNRTCWVRIPGFPLEHLARIEVRSPDPTGNTHLAFAGLLAAGLDGIENMENYRKDYNGDVVRSPVTAESPKGGNVFKMSDGELEASNIISLPTSLPEAIRAVEENGAFITKYLGAEIVDYITAKADNELGERVDIKPVKTADNVIDVLKAQGVEFIEIKFPDSERGVRGVYAPVDEMVSFLEDGIGFDGSSISGKGFIYKSDLVAKINPSSLRIYKDLESGPNIATIWAAPMSTDEYTPNVFTNKKKYESKETSTFPSNRAEAIARLKKEGIETVKFSITDMSGDLKFIDVPVSELNKKSVFSEGIELSDKLKKDFGDTRYLDGIRAVPDFTTLRIIDWQDGSPKEAFFSINLKDKKGEDFKYDPRNILKKVVHEAIDMGYMPILAPEPEFFLLNHDGTPADDRGYYESIAATTPKAVQKTMRDIMLASKSIGMRIRYAHHEVATGQYEIPMDRKPAMEMSDDIMLQKYIVKEAARRNGYIATYDAKVFGGQNGSGMHIHQSLKDITTGKNLFAIQDDAEKGEIIAQAEKDGVFPILLSDLAKSYLAGILKYATVMAPLTNQTANSYARIGVAGREAPTIANLWGHRNRSVPVRIPGFPDESKGAARIEFRMPDAMGTTHLTFASVIHMGLLGIREDLDPGEPLKESAYTLSPEDLEKLGAEQTPKSYIEAIRGLKDSNVAKDFVGFGMVRYLTKVLNEALKRRSMAEARLTPFKVYLDSIGRIGFFDEEKQKTVLEKLQKNGVIIVDPNTTYISPGVIIESGTVIQPEVTIVGSNIRIGENVQIGRGVRISNMTPRVLLFHNGSEIGEGQIVTGSADGALVWRGFMSPASLKGFTSFEGIHPRNVQTGVKDSIEAQRLLQESI